MYFRKTIQIGFGFLALLAFAAIWWSLSTRSKTVDAPSTASPLAPDVSRRSTDFDYSEYREGRVVFRVLSSSNSLSVAGVEHFDEVEVTLYGEDGRPSDRVSGRNAVYDKEGSRIEFSGEVRVRLVDGTEIESNQLTAELGRQRLSIDQRFRFRRGIAQGEGGSMIYRIEERTLEAGGPFRFSTSRASEPVEGEAAGAFYDLRSGRLILLEESWIEGSNYSLRAVETEFSLTSDQVLEWIEARQDARLETGNQTFSGHRISLRFGPAGSGLETFHVWGRRLNGDQWQPARYSESGASPQSLEARTIRARPAVGNYSQGSLNLSSFEADDEVVFRSPRLGQGEALASNAEGRFGDAGWLEWLNMKGGATLTRVFESSRGELRADELTIEFGSGQEPLRTRAAGNVEAARVGEGSTWRLRAQEMAEVFFGEGLVERLVAQGDCYLESTQQSDSFWLRAPTVSARYREGRIESFDAGPMVEAEFRDAQGRPRIESGRMLARYQMGKLHRLNASRSVRLRQSGAEFGIDLRSREALYEPAAGTILFSGNPRLRQTARSQAPDSQTSAREIVVARQSGDIEARGEVRTRVGSEPPMLIRAGRMQALPQTGWVEYSESPQLEQQASVISASRLRLRQQDQSMVAEGEVESRFTQQAKTGATEYRIRSQRVEIFAGGEHIRFQENVEAKSDQLQLWAPWLDWVFVPGESGALAHLHAWGGVELEEPLRKASGEEVFYYPDEDRVRVTGSEQRPARVRDEEGSRATGSELTFYVGQDRLLIEGPKKP